MCTNHDTIHTPRGTLGWAIEQGHITPKHYRFTVLINASVRGPFLPAYWPPDLHWSAALTARLTADVKMVGPTINCEAYQASDGKAWGTNPHVQTYALALDNVRSLVMHVLCGGKRWL